MLVKKAETDLEQHTNNLILTLNLFVYHQSKMIYFQNMRELS